MRRALALLDANLERWLLLVFYVMLVATMFVEVLRREVFSYSSIWGEEIVRYAFIYLAWIGAAAAVKDRAHIRIDVVMEYAGPRLRAALYILGDVAMLAVALVAFRWSLDTALVSARFGSVTPGLRVSQVWFLAAVPLGFGLMMVRLVQSMIRDLRDLRAGRPPYRGDVLFE